MAKFLYLYTGGQMAETPEAQEAAMQEWTNWFGTLGDSVTDIGNPFGAGTTVSNGSGSERRRLQAQRLFDHQRGVAGGCGEQSK